MSKIPIYCSFDLLLKIFDEYNQQQIEVSEADDLILITSLYLFLTRSGKLFLDEDSEKVIQLANNNPYLKNLLKKSSIDSYTQIEYNRFEIEDIEEISKEVHPNTFFLLDTDEVHCQLLEDSYGMIYLNFDKLKKSLSFLFTWSLFNIVKNSNTNIFNSWEKIADFKHPFNSLLIIDNYLLDDNIEIENNLFPLLDNFLPIKLESSEFHLTIVTTIKNNKSDANKSKKELEKWRSSILNKIKEIRDYKFDISISIILTGPEHNHDRNILTNYFWIHSGHSFTYFGNNGQVKKNTNLMIFPIFCQIPKKQDYKGLDNILEGNSILESYLNHRKQMFSIVNKSKNKELPNNTGWILYQYVGEKKNRLFINIEEE